MTFHRRRRPKLYFHTNTVLFTLRANLPHPLRKFGSVPTTHGGNPQDEIAGLPVTRQSQYRSNAP